MNLHLLTRMTLITKI